jgi:hypothetical protein
MKIVIERSYHAEGTNGSLRVNGEPLCHTIELPWKDNLPGASCIPEGSYTLAKRYSEKFGWHLQVQQVPGRDYILLHPANDALKELHGCIAPVQELTGEGRGLHSRPTFEALKALTEVAFLAKEPVLLTINHVTS